MNQFGTNRCDICGILVDIHPFKPGKDVSDFNQFVASDIRILVHDVDEDYGKWVQWSLFFFSEDKIMNTPVEDLMK